MSVFHCIIKPKTQPQLNYPSYSFKISVIQLHVSPCAPPACPKWWLTACHLNNRCGNWAFVGSSTGPVFISRSFNVKKRTSNPRLSLAAQLQHTCGCCFALTAARSQLACRRAGDDSAEQPAGRPRAPLRRLCAIWPARAHLGSRQHNPPRPQDRETVSCPSVRRR